MQPHPGHAGRPCDGVRVIRLMHMPEKTDVGSLHDRMLIVVRIKIQYVIEIKSLQ